MPMNRMTSSSPLSPARKSSLESAEPVWCLHDCPGYGEVIEASSKAKLQLAFQNHSRCRMLSLTAMKRFCPWRNSFHHHRRRLFPVVIPPRSQRRIKATSESELNGLSCK